MKKRIDIIYRTNRQEWALEAIAKKHGYTLKENCYWVQILENQDGDSIVLTREDGELNHDPVGRLIAILETTETETTETETTETETAETETTETETTETETTETADRDAAATGRRFYDTEHGICITDYDLLAMWEADPVTQQEYPRFDWYVAACQTYQGGTLEEIR